MTTIAEQLRMGRTFSFELMPPRTPERERQLTHALEELEPLQPSFVSITYGAGGSTRDRTHALVAQLLHKGDMNPMAHLTCAAHTKQELIDILTRYRDEGLENVLALRGDPPLDATNDLPEGELRRAAELVSLAREVGDFCVAVATHPEGHPKAPDTETDRRHQAAKLASADFGVTQFFFRIEDYLRLVDDIDKLGVDKPIIPGLMPPSNVKQLTRMAELSGTDIPAEVAERLEQAGSDAEDVRRAGVEIVSELGAKLLEAGAPGLHIYTMNKAAATLEIHANLGLDFVRPAPRPVTP